MVEKQVRITHSEDHEFELATMIVQTASRFSSVISIVMDNKRVNAKSIMGMMTLGLMEDDEVVVMADGEDAAEAVESMAKLLNR